MSTRGLVPVGAVCFCAGGLYGWSALIAPLQATFQVSTAQTGLVFSIAIVCFTLAVTATPYIAPRIPPLRRLACFSWAAAISLVLAALSPSYLVFIVYFSAGFGTLSGAIYISAIAIAAGSPHPLRATPIMVAAFGISGAVFGPAWRMLEGEGWGLLVLWPLAVALLLSGLAVWSRPIAHASTQSPQTPKSEAEHTPPAATLILLWLIFGFGSLSGLMVLGLAAKMLDAAQTSIAVSSIALAGIALGNTLGRLSLAGLSLYLPSISSLFISGGVAATGLLLAITGPDGWALSAGLCLIAIGYGVMASAIPSLTHTLYGSTYFQRRFAVIFTGWGLAGFCAPWLAGVIFDATDSFNLAILGAMCATVFSVLGAVVLQVRLRRQSSTP